MTATRVRALVARLVAAGRWGPGEPDILLVFDAGYDASRLARLLADLPVEALGRLRSDRVVRLPVPPRPPGTNGRPGRRGPHFAPAKPATWPPPRAETVTDAIRYGTARAGAWDRLPPRPSRRAAWLDHAGAPPILEGTLIRLRVAHLPGDREAKPVGLWSSTTGAAPAHVDRLWRAFPRRFDLEHAFGLFKQVPGWTAPKIRDPEAADRRTHLVIAAHTRLRLARWPTDDLRRPWERPRSPGGSPRPGCAGGFAASARWSGSRRVRRNPVSLVRGGHSARRTAGPPRVTR